ncbi:hypothetical protein [Conservatibacter flavescens]|uniref:Uncharacterized protein n=1 Tax=Conservatibacter flavescens TaxID=28161 RepID=A0A2M8S514_9PAST|nr:hypothetical protein [Conservatibacter flavescens]PJG86188.1 hypothetical protein CVP05_03185 [Conservatibacter flavescens]
MKVYSEFAGRALNKETKAVYEATVKLELAMLECEEMDLEVTGVEWGGGYQPRIILRENDKTKRFVENGSAQMFGVKTKAGVRYDFYQMHVRGVKCIWEGKQNYSNELKQKFNH